MEERYFILIECLQFFAGLAVIVGSYVFILKHREPLLESAFGDNIRIRNSFKSLTSIGYFMVFSPVLLFGIDISSPKVYFPADHIQRVIYFEAGLIFLIGILHFGIVSIFSMKITS